MRIAAIFLLATACFGQIPIPGPVAGAGGGGSGGSTTTASLYSAAATPAQVAPSPFSVVGSAAGAGAQTAGCTTATAPSGFYLSWWRLNNEGNYDLIFESPNLFSTTTAGQVNTYTPSGTVYLLTGDITGIRCVNADSNRLFLNRNSMQNVRQDGILDHARYYVGSTTVGTNALTAQAASNGLSYSVDGYALGATPINFAGLGASSVNVPVVEVYEQNSPVFISLGTSIPGGQRSNTNLADSFGGTQINPSNPPAQMGWWVSQQLGYSWQNLSIAGATLSNIIGEVNAAIPLHPQFVTMDGGINEMLLAQPCSNATTGLTTAWTSLAAAGIHTYWMTIEPSSDPAWVGATVDACNTSIIALAAASFPTSVTVVDNRKYIGQYSTSGPAGNYWTPKPGMIGPDGIHPLVPGAQVMGASFVDALEPATAASSNAGTVVSVNAASTGHPYAFWRQSQYATNLLNYPPNFPFPNQWAPANPPPSNGGVAPPTPQTYFNNTWASTVVFDMTHGNQGITLSAGNTAISAINIVPGVQYIFTFVQNGTAAGTITCAAPIFYCGAPSINTGATSVQEFVGWQPSPGAQVQLRAVGPIWSDGAPAAGTYPVTINGGQNQTLNGAGITSAATANTIMARDGSNNARANSFFAAQDVWLGRLLCMSATCNSTILTAGASNGILLLQNAAQTAFTSLIFGTAALGSPQLLITNQTNPTISVVDGAGGATANLLVPAQKSTTGQRFVCITTTGQLISSTTACVGT
jgi:lysophospholipase L1-like esterase